MLVCTCGKEANVSDRPDGHFYLGELADGRFVAASSNSPFFCFRGDTEQAVLDKVGKALRFYASTKGRDADVRVKSVSQIITTVRPKRRVYVNEIVQRQVA